jgi:deazaflavin-dependent oxidoreductase (nitroreductase family)
MPLKGEYAPSKSDWARKQAELYEATSGEEGGTPRGMPVVASLGGVLRNPVWYYNLKKNAHVELQDGATKREYTARELTGDEKKTWWRRAVEAYPDYAPYQENTKRQIPVFVLEPIE